jgi:hypothetical protein
MKIVLIVNIYIYIYIYIYLLEEHWNDPMLYETLLFQ